MRKFTEKLKSLLLIILGLSVPVLWTAYIYIQFDPDEAGALQLENSFWIFTEDVQHAETVADERFFSPVSVSLVLSGKGYTSAFNPQLTEVLHNNTASLVTEVFSSSYVCEVADTEDWNNALGKSDFILIEYPSQLPYAYIAEFLHTSKEFCDGELCYTQKLLLFNDDKNVLTALSSDRNGNVFSFKRNSEEAPSLIYDFNSNNLAAYTVNKGFIPFEFNRQPSNDKIFGHLPSDYKLLTTAPSLPSLSAETPLQSILDGIFGKETITYLELVEDETLSEIFNIFNINPNIVGYYSDMHSGLYFVGENMHLVISPDGKVTYSVTDKDSPVLSTATLLNTTRTNFSSDEILTAATVFASGFTSDILGGEATPLLKNVGYSSKNDEINFTFGYYYRLTDVLYKGDNNAITLTFNKHGLIRAEFLPMRLTKLTVQTETDDSTASHESMLTTDTLPSLVAQLLEKDSVLRPVYEFDAFGGTVTPYWVAGGQ